MKPSRSSPFVSCSLLAAACLLFCEAASAVPTISLSLQSGPPTSKILVSGQGFEPNVGVDIYFDTKDEALVVTNSDGKFENANAHAPRSAYPGQHWVTALERNNDKGAQVPFLVQTDWAQDDFDNARTGLNPYENVLDERTVANLTLEWTYPTGGQVFSSPAVVGGTTYFTSLDHNVYAVNAETGALRWKFTTGNEIWSSPTVAAGIVYLGSTDSNFYALDAQTGTLLWKASTGRAESVFGSPAVAEGAVFAVSRYHIYSWDAKSGTLIWSDQIGGYSGPAVVNGVVYFASTDSVLYALNAKTGTTQWSFSEGTKGVGDPSVWNGSVYFQYCDGSESCFTSALNAGTGAQIWRTSTGFFGASPSISNGIAYASSTTTVFALDALTGNLIWSYANGGIVYWSPAIANGIVYFASTDAALYALDGNTGSLLWIGATGGQIYSSPSVANGKVYVGAYDGKLYAFGLDRLERPVPKRSDLKMLRPDFRLELSKLGPKF